MPIEQITEKTIHLERTSESNAEPAVWVIAEIQRHLDTLPREVRTQVLFHGWRDSTLSYPFRMSDLELAQARGAMGADTFAHWCPEACSIPLPEAELLIRWGTARPSWADPAAVDLADPVAGELIELSLNRFARLTGVDLAGEVAP